MPTQVTDEAQLLSLGERLARQLSEGDCLLLHGELGAGKTTLCRGVVRGLGYTGNVTSPTFVRLNVLGESPPIYHMDFYQIEDLSELEAMGIYDYLGDPYAISIVEWWKKFPQVCPESAWQVDIETENTRRIIRITNPKGHPWPKN